ncbi:MAG: transcriptional regulator, partial [Lachnospiraceae bacterium]|nr:transcriptional regulator [Lachnospiraceae bacterium]
AKVTEGVVKEVDYLLREREEKEEERYRMLDETMREIQKARQQVAATEVEVKEKEEKKGFFRKKKKNK